VNDFTHFTRNRQTDKQTDKEKDISTAKALTFASEGLIMNIKV